MKLNKIKDKLKKTFTKEKTIRFLDKQGFYIVLFICISIIGVTAFLTSGNNKKPKPQELANEDNINKSIIREYDGLGTLGIKEEKIKIKIKDSSPPTEEDKASEGITMETLAQEEAEPKKEDKKEDKKEEKKVTTKKTSPQTGMVFPVDGKIIKGHSIDDLVFSNTLKEWSTHSGIDIESPVGSEVKAAMSGTVVEVTEDPLMGICITLEHDNGLKTYYANLSTGNMVSKGQKVDKGQIISGVGRTAGCEILDEPHLHFEVLQNDISVDPIGYLN